MLCFVYILYSVSLDLYYIGCSENPQERLKKHLARHKGFTAKAKDWEICYTECYSGKAGALKREKQLKGWKNRERILQLIKIAQL
ncbi:MAG TPA: GIY-YIG nuclease family protein [Chitinophagaceae bacterium]